jgi:hypothetical protein
MSDPTLRNAAADGAAVNLEAAFFSIHNGATSGDQVSNQRLAPAYTTAAGSVAALTSTLSFTGTGSSAVSHLGVWTTIGPTGGTFRFAVALAGDSTFNAAGDLDLTAAPITVS